ncbi:hypothetical protein KIN20_023435 [Parelaphostrongylus tenuis]|uniref:Uncharacterized protein n=1 Tax=Parelaphostrongylus tenuis TaxID=148309 RepID=A0AAD5NA38_PARTN|nr:hypothetical protein KIN20_023435 [Parelaphostrongylus tenuis]
MKWWMLFCLVVGRCTAHVRFTYPPARYPISDYYTSFNSRPPCGAPKPSLGTGLRTFLKAGSTIDLQWATTVPHMGGIRLEVLNSLDEPIAIFTNFNDPYNVTDFGRQIALPLGFECANCAIRITHQATEYGNDYLFYSCADVNILKEIPDGDTCLSHGTRKDGVCYCQPNFFGDQCQFEAECSSDDDCGVHGLCLTNPNDGARECFCPGGRFGERCQKETTAIGSASEFNETLYMLREVEDNKIYWRILNDEIEMVLRYPGESWMAIGWKPHDFECPRFFPQLGLPDFSPDTVSKPHRIDAKPMEFVSDVSTPRTRSTTIKATTLRSSTSSPVSSTKETSGEDCGPNEQWSSCPEMSRECEPSCDWTRFPETIPNCPRSCGTARCVCKEGFVRMNNDEGTCVPFEFCDKEAEPSCPVNSTWAKCGVACEPSCANMYDTAPCPATCEKSACTCADNYVRHEGHCIYWGDCPDIDSHFHEITGNDSTIAIQRASIVTVDLPLQTRTSLKATTSTTTSSFENLTCAVNETVAECGKVCEADCVTIFTRAECDDCGTPACTCMQGYARNPEGVCVYWGDCPIDTMQTQTQTHLVTTVPSTSHESEKKSKLKVGGDVCYGDFRYPSGCSDCDYKLTWNYIDESDDIEFSLETKLQSNSWTGVGFSKDGSMICFPL